MPGLGHRRLLLAVVLSALALILLEKVRELEAYSERMLVEASIRNMRTGMLLAAVERERNGGGSGEAGANPVRWLATPPSGYIGECAGGVRQMAAGTWCFDVREKSLVYRLRYPERLRTENAVEGVIRWRVVAGNKAGNIRMSDLRLEANSPYAWE